MRNDTELNRPASTELTPHHPRGVFANTAATTTKRAAKAKPNVPQQKPRIVRLISEMTQMTHVAYEVQNSQFIITVAPDVPQPDEASYASLVALAASSLIDPDLFELTTDKTDCIQNTPIISLDLVHCAEYIDSLSGSLLAFIQAHSVKLADPRFSFKAPKQDCSNLLGLDEETAKVIAMLFPHLKLNEADSESLRFFQLKLEESQEMLPEHTAAKQAYNYNREQVLNAFYNEVAAAAKLLIRTEQLYANAEGAINKGVQLPEGKAGDKTCGLYDVKLLLIDRAVVQGLQLHAALMELSVHTALVKSPHAKRADLLKLYTDKLQNLSIRPEELMKKCAYYSEESQLSQWLDPELKKQLLQLHINLAELLKPRDYLLTLHCKLKLVNHKEKILKQDTCGVNKIKLLENAIEEASSAPQLQTLLQILAQEHLPEESELKRKLAQAQLFVDVEAKPGSIFEIQY